MQFLIQMAYITQGGFHYYYTLFGIFNNDVYKQLKVICWVLICNCFMTWFKEIYMVRIQTFLSLLCISCLGERIVFK